MSSALSKHIEDRWETVEESPGIWVTRPMGNTNPQHDDDDSWCTDSEEAVLLAQHTDEALQRQHNDAEDLPVILPDEYETSDAEHDSDVEMHESGWAWHARLPDTVFVPDSEEDLVEKEDSNAGDEQTKADGKGTEASTVEVGNGLGDSTDSNFDSDEVLSGDEYVLRSLERAPSGPAPERCQRPCDSTDSDLDSDEVLSGDEQIW